MSGLAASRRNQGSTMKLGLRLGGHLVPTHNH